MGQKDAKWLHHAFTKKFTLLKDLHAVAKEDPEARTVGGWVVHDGSQLKKSPLFLFAVNTSPMFTSKQQRWQPLMMHLMLSKASTWMSHIDIMTRKGNDEQMGNSCTRATGYILCAGKTRSLLFYQFRPQGFLKMADDPTARHAWPLFRGPLAIDTNQWMILVWLSIDHRLSDTNRYQLTNVIDWYRLIDWFSDHRFSSTGYAGLKRARPAAGLIAVSSQSLKQCENDIWSNFSRWKGLNRSYHFLGE